MSRPLCTARRNGGHTKAASYRTFAARAATHGPRAAAQIARLEHANIQAALESVGASFNDVAKLTYFVLDATQMPVVREVRDQFVNRAQPPASSAFEVRRLVGEGFLIEVEAISTPISDGALVLKISNALPNFSESMTAPGKVLTNYFKLWQQV